MKKSAIILATIFAIGISSAYAQAPAATSTTKSTKACTGKGSCCKGKKTSAKAAKTTTTAPATK
jgi:hypothetical protein